MFAEARTPTGFVAATFDAETAPCVWPGGADLAPDTLDERIRPEPGRTGASRPKRDRKHRPDLPSVGMRDDQQRRPSPRSDAERQRPAVRYRATASTLATSGGESLARRSEAVLFVAAAQADLSKIGDSG